MRVYRNLQDLPEFDQTIITIGSFDGVHSGHQNILKRLKSLADEHQVESVVVTFHPHPRLILDKSDNDIQLLNTLEEKLRLLEAYGVDNVVVVPFTFEFSQQTPNEYIEKFIYQCFKPKFIVIGYDHRFGMNRAGDLYFLKQNEEKFQYQVIEISKKEIDEIAVSSSKIRNYLLHGNISEANLFLNSPYLLSGKVIHGDKIGSKIGYPTANLHISEKYKLIPKAGVYAVSLTVENATFDGMMYIGNRPTLSDKLGVNIEINIFDFNQNIYDKDIVVQIISFLRTDEKFGSMEALTEQLHLDEKNAHIALNSAKTKKPDKIKATIAILNYNGVDFLESYLPLVDYSSEQYSFEILVIDNASTDSSVEYIKEWHPEVKIKELSKNHGFAQGYNIGLKEVVSDYTVLLNSDVRITPDWLTPLIELLDSDSTIAAVQPKICALEDKTKFEYAGAAGGFIDRLGYPFCRGRVLNEVETDLGQYDDAIDVFWTSGAAMIIRTSLFKAIGGFDKGFFAHQEEIDLCWRMLQAGYKLKCVPSSKVYHLGGGTLDYQNPRKDFLNFRNNMYLLTKHESLTKLLWLVPFKLVLDGLAGVKFLFDFKPQSTIAVIKAHLSYYIHLPLVIERRNYETLLIQKCTIGKPNLGSRYGGSIIWDYYIGWHRTYKQIMSKTKWF